MTDNKSLFSTYKAYDGGTDKTKITRKPSKTGKHGHGKRKSVQKPEASVKYDTPLEPETNQDVDFEPTVVNEPDNVKTSSMCCYKMMFSCTIGYKIVNANFIPSLSVNLITKSFYYSINEDKDDHEGKSPAEALIDIPVFVGKFSILTSFIIIDDEDVTRDVALGMPFFMKYVSCQMVMKKFAHRDKWERMTDE
ncbi:hypothetical protein Tco_0807449 [Tanacetum coccineum]